MVGLQHTNLKEKHLRDLERIVSSHESDYEEMGRLARNAYDKYFAEPVYFNYVVDNCLEIRETQLIPESVYWRLAPVIVSALKIKDKVRLRGRVRSLLTGNEGSRSLSPRPIAVGQTKANE